MAAKKSKATGTGVPAGHSKHVKAATKTGKVLQAEMGKLQAALKQLKKDSNADVQLSRLPTSRRITGSETHAEKLKLVKAAIKDAFREQSHGAALAADTHSAAWQEKHTFKVTPESTMSNAWMSAHMPYAKAETPTDGGLHGFLDVRRGRGRRGVRGGLGDQKAVEVETRKLSKSEAQQQTVAAQLKMVKAYPGAVSELALFTGESKAFVEAEAPHEYIKIAKARQDCVNSLSNFFPIEAVTVNIALIGQASHARASLLGLPLNIQEQIYRLVLVEDHSICVTSSNYKQPAIVRTCQQLRMETLWIYETENTFSIEVKDCQPMVPKNYTTHWARQVFCKLETSGEPKWDGLRKWLKAYHEDGVPSFCDHGPGRSTAWDVCGQAFELVLSLRTLFPDITFEEMEPTLKIWKDTVSLQQVDWTWE